MAVLNVRVDEELKKKAVELFKDLGLDMSTAINMFLRQSIIRDGLPFEVVREVPNAVTVAALREVEEMKKNPDGCKGYTDLDEMWADIENDD